MFKTNLRFSQFSLVFQWFSRWFSPVAVASVALVHWYTCGLACDTWPKPDGTGRTDIDRDGRDGTDGHGQTGRADRQYGRDGRTECTCICINVDFFQVFYAPVCSSMLTLLRSG